LKSKTDVKTGHQEWWDVEEVRGTDCTPSKPDQSNILPMDDHCEAEHLNMYTFNEKTFPPTLSFISGGG
jgi:hypothetical protein